MNIIRITTKNEISIHEFPKGNYHVQNKTFRELIGPCCEMYEHVMPRRLYLEMGDCVSMLMDEEALYHDLEDNMVGSYLYEADKHGHVIKGNILIVGEVWTPDGIDFCGISDSKFNLLYPKLEKLVKKARDFK